MAGLSWTRNADLGNRRAWETLIAGPMAGRPIKRVVCTHMHPDHIGMAGWLTRRFDCPFWMTRLEYVTCRMLVADTGREAPTDALRFYKGIRLEARRPGALQGSLRRIWQMVYGHCRTAITGVAWDQTAHWRPRLALRSWAAAITRAFCPLLSGVAPVDFR